MNAENHHAKFNHEEWIEHLYQSMETARQFCSELFKALKTLSQKGLREAWKDIRLAVSKLTPQDFIVTGLLTLTGMFGVMVFMIGFSLLSYQSILWLQNGVWTEYPLVVIFNFLFDNTAFQLWMTQPESWVGLQKLFSWFLESVPISLALMVPGFSITLFMAGIITAALLYRFYQLKKKNG
jgi:hypothetical protein